MPEKPLGLTPSSLNAHEIRRQIQQNSAALPDASGSFQTGQFSREKRVKFQRDVTLGAEFRIGQGDRVHVEAVGHVHAVPVEYLVALLRHTREVKGNPGVWMPWNYEETLARLAVDKVK